MSNTVDERLRTEIFAIGIGDPIAKICNGMMDGIPEVTAWLTADPNKLHENTLRLSEELGKQVQNIIDRMAIENQGALRFAQSETQINERKSILARLDRRLRRLGRRRWALRLAISLLLFAALFVAVLRFHSEAAYFAEHLGAGELRSFIVLAAVMLPVDFGRTRLEHYFERQLSSKEREDAANDYADLVRIAVRTLIEVSRAYA